jgi:hypothetical protein
MSQANRVNAADFREGDYKPLRSALEAARRWLTTPMPMKSQ